VLLLGGGLHLVAQPVVADPALASGLLTLTPEEQTWLAEHPRIRVAVDRSLVPFDYLDEEGNHLGISSSYLRLFSERTGVEVEIVADAPWTELVEQVSHGKLDAVACIVPTAERAERLRFSAPYASFPTVIVTQDDERFVNGLKSLAGRTVAVEAGYYTEEILRRDWPKLKLARYETRLEALEAVSNGEAEAYVGNLAAATYFIRRENLANLQVASPTIIGRTELAFGLPKDAEILAGLFNKVLAGVDDVARNQIEQEWVAVRFEHVRLLILGKWGLAVLVVVAFALIWNFTQAREIRRRRRAEAQVREALERLEQLGHNVPNGAVYQLELTADGQSRFRYLTNQFESFFGRPLSELYSASRGFIDIIDPKERQRYLEARTVSQRELSNLRLEIGIVNDRGEHRFLELRATPRREGDGATVWDGVAIDVTDYRRALEKIEHDEERLRLVIEAAKLGVWEWDAQAGDTGIYTINRRQAELHGLPLDQRTPPLTDAARNVLETDRRKMLQSIRLLVRGDSIEEVAEYRVKIGDGEDRWIYSQGRVISRTADGRPRQAVGISTDITARKRFEESMRHAKEIAEAMNHQKSEFLGMAAHDLKNPLSSITGLASLLEEMMAADGSLRADDPEAREMLGLIRSSASHMLQLIHDLLNLERIESGLSGLRLGSGDAVTPLLRALDLNRAQAHSKHIQLHCSMPDSCVAEIDAERLGEVFDNLINNAIKYSPTASEVRVSLESLPPVGSEGEELPGFRFKVRDSGPGLRPQDFAELFKKFKRLSARPTGGESSTGLGLSIVKSLVNQHGGEVWAENHPEGGAVFTVEVLPRSRRPE
jgi:signal transduction histidine kinase/ABC-type amino acid transport substrate-binding protein